MKKVKKKEIKITQKEGLIHHLIRPQTTLTPENRNNRL